MKVWSTKYALTKGILEVVGKLHKNPKIFKVDQRHGSYTLLFAPYWHLTEAEAIQHAEVLREKKLMSLKNQLLKLETLQF